MGTPRERHDGRRVPRPRHARRAVQPAPHGRLPRGLQGPHRAVARASRADGIVPGRRIASPRRRWCDEGAAGGRRGGDRHVAAPADAGAATGARARRARRRRRGARQGRRHATGRAGRRAAAKRRAAARRRALARRCAAVRGPLAGESRTGLIGAPGSFAAPAPFAAAPAPAPPPAARPPVSRPPAPGPAEPAAAAPPVYSNPHAVQVQGFEFGLQLSKATVSAGDVRVEFNLSRAEDPHNLWLVREDGSGTPYRLRRGALGRRRRADARAHARPLEAVLLARRPRGGRDARDADRGVSVTAGETAARGSVRRCAAAGPRRARRKPTARRGPRRPAGPARRRPARSARPRRRRGPARCCPAP